MKKFLLLIVTGIATIVFANAQEIAIKGSGVIDKDNVNITFDEFSNIDHVVVEAMAFIITGSNTPPEAKVLFNEKEADFNYVEVNKSLGPNPFDYKDGTYSHKGYYTMTFDDTEIAGGVELDKNGLGNEIETYYAYVYYDDGDVTTYSLHEDVPVDGFDFPRRAFIHVNGKSNPVVYHFTLGEYDGTRDIELAIPFSDNEPEAERYVSVTLHGPVAETNDDFILNEVGDNLRVEILTLTDVPGDFTDILVEVYSQNQNAPDFNPITGDSFFIGLPIISVTDKPNEQVGCTYTQGYWKTHSDPSKKKYDPTWGDLSEEGPKTMFFKSGDDYEDVLKTPVKGNAYYILAHQYIATKLNFLSGADDAEVIDVFNLATRFFNAFTPEKVERLTGDRAKYIHNLATSWAEVLDDYNNGLIGPGHCDDVEVEVENEDEEVAQVRDQEKEKGKGKGKNKSAEIETGIAQINDLNVYPNPVLNVATVAFTPVFDGNVRIDVYNSVGQQALRLMDRNVSKDVPLEIRLKANEFKEGLYILRVQNENSAATIRVKISRQ